MGTRTCTWLAAASILAVAALLLVTEPSSAQVPPLGSLARGPGPAPTWLSGRQIDNARSAVAIGGVVLLGAGMLLRRRGRPDDFRRLRDGLLIALGIAGGLGGWNFLQFHNPGYLHPSDSYHYFVGAKYFRELGYTRLYECSTLAEYEAGFAKKLDGARVRNLETNRIEDTARILGEPEHCKRHFTPERWRDFRADVAWFRSHHAPTLWRRVHQDHGYNATPAWTVAGSILTNLAGPIGPLVQRLTWIDPLLLLTAWGCIAWAFGWRSLCVGLIFWGTFQTAPFSWTGGSILRHDWLASLVLGLCLLKRERPGLAGFFLALSALLRIFPAVVFAGLALKFIFQLRSAGEWVMPREAVRIGLGAAVAIGLAVPASLAVTTNSAVWSDFAQNSRVHLDTPLRNHLGLQTVLSYDHDTRTAVSRDRDASDPYEVWKRGRRDAFARRKPVFIALVSGFAGLLAWAVRRQSSVVAAIAGLGFIPIALELTGYYYAALLGYALLSRSDPRVGFALCGLSSLSWLSVQLWHSYDESYTWTSLACVVFAFALTAALGLRGAGVEGRRGPRCAGPRALR